jgi:hypothetical protein
MSKTPEEITAFLITALKQRAELERKIITLCAWCGNYIGEVASAGVAGISHGICEPCAEQLKLDSHAHETFRAVEQRRIEVQVLE